MSVATLSVSPATPTIGATISGVDLSAPLDDGTVAAIRQALLDHLVLFFRDQELDDEKHLAFAGRFGDVTIPVFKTPPSQRPEIPVLDQPDARDHLAARCHPDNPSLSDPPMG